MWKAICITKNSIDEYKDKLSVFVMGYKRNVQYESFQVRYETACKWSQIILYTYKDRFEIIESAKQLKCSDAAWMQSRDEILCRHIWCEVLCCM